MTRPLRLCLAASGGGHVRQLLDLEPVWAQHDRFFITEDTALGRSLGGEHRTYLVPHVAWGQVKHGALFKFIGGTIRSLWLSARTIWRERPDVVITSGAGAVFFAVLWARLTGACVIVIESFARFDHPSLFGRLAAPLAHHMIIQSDRLSAAYPKARVFDPFRRLPAQQPPQKDPLIFATVGATLPFERLVTAVTGLAAGGGAGERILLQTGVPVAGAPGVDLVENLPFAEVTELLKRARVVVCHSGTGSIITALREGCHVITMPRDPKRGEHYDNHQLEIASAFEERGLVQIANSEAELREALDRTRARQPVMATVDPQELIGFLQQVLAAPPEQRKRLAI